MKVDGVLRMLLRACAKAGGQKAWAEARGMSQQHVSDVLNRRREPGPKVLDALGMERCETRYRRKEPDHA